MPRRGPVPAPWTALLLAAAAAAAAAAEAAAAVAAKADPDDSAWPVLTSTSAADAVTRSPRVLNFFPVTIDEECLANDGRRSGVCMNTYECRFQNGQSFGPCAMGLGVCCVFTATCGGKIYNNVTYFMSPNFPALYRNTTMCELEVQKIAPEISQLRLDFAHFNLGQPNRRTGICDSDVFTISGGSGSEVRLCGINNGQHIYYDVDYIETPIKIMVNLSQGNYDRLWEIKISQMEFQKRAPVGCLQYFKEPAGVIQTMNFAVNGRHLANQDYKICMRQAMGRCSIAYEPCDENSFRIGPQMQQDTLNDVGSGNGANDFPSGMSSSRECNDRIVMPCDSEDEFIMPKQNSPMLCDLLHCGNSFCQDGETTCRIESSTTPFHIQVQFGPATQEESPDDNLGMCLHYEQLPCTV